MLNFFDRLKLVTNISTERQVINYLPLPIILHVRNIVINPVCFTYYNQHYIARCSKTLNLSSKNELSKLRLFI